MDIILVTPTAWSAVCRMVQAVDSACWRESDGTDDSRGHRWGHSAGDTAFCGQGRGHSILCGPDSWGYTHSWAGMGSRGDTVFNEGSKTQTEYREIIQRHHTELLATMAGKLRAVPEGDGDMLDNTLIIFLSDSSDNHHGSGMEWPYLIIGGGGGKLKLPGRYLRYPKYGDPGCRTIGDWWTTLLNAYGNPVRYFGNEDLVLKQNGCSHAGPLEELLV